MKKFTAILLTVIMVASLFISCNDSIAPTVTDETVSVSFTEATSRSLTASLEEFKKGDYYWKYAAKKNTADGTGLNSGATGSYDVNGAVWIKGENNKGLGSVAGFSQGIWDFKLFAYKQETVTNASTSTTSVVYKLAYQGEVTGVSLKKGSANTVTVTVSPVAGDKGTLVLADTISLAPAKEGDTPSTDLAKVYTVTALGGTAAISPDQNQTKQWTLDAGAYKVNVDFVKDGFTYASGSVVATVYSNITTTVSGDLAELVTKAEFDSSINPDVMNKEASSGSVDLGTLTPQSDVILKDATTIEASTVVAKVPADAASQIINTVVGSASSTKNTIDLALRVDTVSATNTSLELEIGMQATIVQYDAANKVINQTTQKVTELKNSDQQSVISEVTIKLQPGLRNVVVKHNGITMTDLNTTTGDQGYTYDATTGTLKIWTSSFSPFSVTYQAPEYVAKIGDVRYTTLQAAVDAAGSGATIVLTKDVSLSSLVKIEKDVTLDLNGYNIQGGKTWALFVKGCRVEIIGSGNISVSEGIDESNSVIFVGNANNDSYLKIGENVKVISDYSYGITGYGTKRITIVVDGEVKTKVAPAISGNGSSGLATTDITINGTVETTNENAIYHPQSGTLTIKGTVRGLGGIEAKAGTVSISENAIIEATAQTTSHNAISNGCSTSGYAVVAVENNDYKGGTSFNISAGKIIGPIGIVSDNEVSEDKKASISISGGSFTDLASAIKYASSGATIKLAADVTGKGIGSADGTKTRDSLTIDFNGHTYTMNDPAVGSTGTKSQAMHWGKSLEAVTLKNGTFKVAKGTTGVKMAMQNYINFTAENMTFDFTYIPVINYGTTGDFDPNNGEYKEYSGLEVPMFNNGNEGTMVLRNCTISMPESSVKGINNYGKEIMIDSCTINGAVVIESANKVVKVKNSKITKGVSPYFSSGYTVKTSEENGYTVYTNQTVVKISTIDELNTAITNATDKKANISIASGITITLDNGIANEGENSRDITFIGDGSQTVDVITNTINAEGGQLSYQRGSSFTFENLTIQAGEGSFDGIVCNELTFKDCTIKGKLTLFGKATFINCTFDNTMANQYSIWTWGGTDVTFEGCTFNTNGKAILLYGGASGSNPTNLVVNNCTFNDRNNGTAGKAAIEIGNDYNATYTLTVNNATVTGFAEGKNTGSKLWANKDSMDAANLTVTINGNRVH